jgi:hypothetical protein
MQIIILHIFLLPSTLYLLFDPLDAASHNHLFNPLKTDQHIFDHFGNKDTHGHLS